MRKRWTAALLAILLAAALLPAPARAAAADDGSAGSRLTGVEREIYQRLKDEVTKVAKGTRTSTEFRIPDLKGLSWTLEELGAAGGRQDDILSKLRQRFFQTVDMERIYTCLSADCPYELFWKSNQYASGYSMAREGSRVSILDLTIQIQVAQDYRGSSATAVDSAKIAAANKAVSAAQAIVDRNRDKSDGEKLAAYREEICRLVSYETSIMDSTPYGDPWQLVHVFDGDPDTNVVCEGYAKAFKYLCDLSEFRSSVVCRTVTGTMGGVGHMWNVVQMGDGKNYLVDVTNCDSGAIGADDKLFLTGVETSNGGRTCTVSKGSCHAVYTYDSAEEGLFTDGWLALSGADYVEGPGVTVIVGPSETQPPETQPPVSLSFQDVGPGEYYADSVAWAVEQSITKGTSDTTFSPGQPCTHGQILTFLWRAAGEVPSDAQAPIPLEGSEYYAGAVRWAAGEEMLKEGFDPQAVCTRSDAVWYIWCAFQRLSAPASSFTDVPAGADYAQAVDWALEKGVTKGTSDTTFAPSDGCTRGEIVTFLYRAYH